MEKSKEVETIRSVLPKSNGTPVEVKKEDSPGALVLAREEVLMIHLLYEREQRINAEMNLLRKEQEFIKLQMSQKYSVNLSEYAVDVATGIARRNG
jgi:hypothetical protein